MTEGERGDNKLRSANLEAIGPAILSNEDLFHAVAARNELEKQGKIQAKALNFFLPFLSRTLGQFSKKVRFFFRGGRPDGRRDGAKSKGFCSQEGGGEGGV